MLILFISDRQSLNCRCLINDYEGRKREREEEERREEKIQGGGEGAGERKGRLLGKKEKILPKPTVFGSCTLPLLKCQGLHNTFLRLALSVYTYLCLAPPTPLGPCSRFPYHAARCYGKGAFSYIDYRLTPPCYTL